MPGNATEPLLTVHVDAERGFSGGEVQVFLLLEGLRARGERVLLVAPPDSGALREARSRGIECAAVAMRGEWDLWSAWRIARLLKERRADLVHLHTGRANWLGGLAARLSGVPAITTRRMDREVKRNLRTRILYGSWVRRAVAISGPVAELLRAGGVPPGKIEVIRSSIDAAALKPGRERAAWRAELGAADGDMVVLVLANLVRRKGVDVLLEALSRAQLARTRLWIGGEGEERAALEAQCARLGLGSSVRFLGRQQDKAGLILACDVFCLPSRREGLGVAALEALALARPVLASAVGGLGEAVEDERSGLLVPPEDPAALAAALERLESDPALRARLGAGGEHSLARGYRAEQMVEGYAQLYSRVLAECRP